MLNANHLAQTLTGRFGVPITGEAADGIDGKRVTFRPSDIPAAQGFSIETLIGWRTVETQFLPGTFAAHLLASMANANSDQQATFSTFIRSALRDGAKVTFRINSQDVDPFQSTAWPHDWHSLVLSMAKGPMLIDGADPSALDTLALTWSSRLLGTCLALMPLEPIEPVSIGEAEGGSTQVLVNRYERSQINRAACIEFHGTRCKVCDFDFARVYGEIGQGFIEVHHIEPVSGIVPGTIIDPTSDLVPLCANCHAMAHRRKPPYNVAELRNLIEQAAQKNAP